MKTQYLDVKEFAQIVNISKQAVYNRLNKDLKPFVKEIDGKKCISVKALQLFKSTGVSTFDSTNEKSVSTEIQLFKTQIEALNNTVAELKEACKSKDLQIEKLQNQLIELAAAQVNILNKQNQLIENSQVLLLQKQHNEAVSTVETNVQQVEETETKPIKQSLFSRLFNKKSGN